MGGMGQGGDKRNIRLLLFFPLSPCPFLVDMLVTVTHNASMMLQLNPTQFATVSIEPLEEMSSAEFFDFCQRHPDLRIEREANGAVIIMSPVGGATGNRNSLLNARIVMWAVQNGSGIVFDSSTGFILPDGSIKSPDVAWVTRDRLRNLTAAQKQRFLPLAPDFVIELRSPTDRLLPLRAKMAAYIDNGVRLGWLIDPSHRIVWVYRPDADPLRLLNPQTINDEAVLPNFTLQLADIFDPDW